MDAIIDWLYFQSRPDFINEGYKGKEALAASEQAGKLDVSLSPEQRKAFEEFMEKEVNCQELDRISSFFCGLEIGAKLILELNANDSRRNPESPDTM